MTVAGTLSQPVLQFTDANGAPLVGGTVGFYQPNSLTLKPVWADEAQTIPLTNPVPLDAAGRPQTGGATEVGLWGTGQYTVRVLDANENLVTVGLIESLRSQSEPTVFPPPQFVTPYQFGATGDGVHDDTAAIQAAYDYFSSGGCVAFIPQGTFLISAPIQVGSFTQTEGFNSAIVTNSPTADHFQLKPSGEQVWKDLTLWSTVVKTSGVGWRGLGMINNSSWYNCRATTLDESEEAGQNRLFRGWSFDQSFGRVYLDKACVANCQDIGVALVAPTGTSAAAEAQLDLRILNARIGVYVGGGSGGVYCNGEISICTVGVQIDAALGPRNREVFFQPGSVIDTCTDYGIHILPDSLSLLLAEGNWVAATGNGAPGQGVGVFLEQTPGVLVNYGQGKFVGTFFFANKSTALLNEGMVILCAGDLFQSNADAVVLSGPGANGSSVQACNFVADTGTGVTLTNGITEYSVDGNNFFGEATAAIGGPSVNWSISQAIQNNVGYPTSNGGRVTMANGTNQIDFAHGLVGTPVIVLISTSDAGSEFEVANVTNANITVIRNGNAVADVTIFWKAEMGPNA